MCARLITWVSIAVAFCHVSSGLPKLSDRPLRIASFNIQVFGTRKLKTQLTQKSLTKILQRYDVVMIQEIRDSSGKAFPALLAFTNNLSPLDPFKTVISERLGRTSSKEQYGFLYRPSRLEVVDTFQYDDGVDNGEDSFEREPFAVRFRSKTTELREFAIIATHIAPRQAVEEIDKLTLVYDAVAKHWNMKSILLAGDLNADCSYVGPSEWQNVSLRMQPRFKWLLDDSEDTTTGDSDCSYDRFVTASTEFIDNLVPGSVQVYKFDRDLDLSRDEARAVSDHYPIELQLRGRVNKELQKTYHVGLTFVVTSQEPVSNVNVLRRIYRHRSPDISGYNVQLYLVGARMHHVTATAYKVKDVIGSLFKFRQVFRDVLSDNMLALVKAFMTSPELPSNIFINGLNTKDSNVYDVAVTCRLQVPYTCKIEVTKFMT